MMLDTRGEPLEKLKSHDDDHAKHLRCGGDWCDMSMQRNGEYCMHKVHRSYKYTIQRIDEVLTAGVAVDVVVEGDSFVKKEQSVAAE